MILYFILFMFFSVIVITLILLIVCIYCFGITSIISKIFKRYRLRSYDKEFKNNLPYNEQQQCYICLQSITNPVVTTCNHSFCGQCMKKFIKSKNMKAVNCPACRKRISLIYRRFKVQNKQQTVLMRFFCKYNCQYSQEPNFWRSVIHFEGLVKRVSLLLTTKGLQYLLKRHRLKAILIMSFYIMAPIDLLPQLFFGPFGIVDDVLIGVTLFRNMSTLVINFIREQVTLSEN